MILSGKVHKEDELWIIEIPDLEIITQGLNRKDSFKMLNAWFVDYLELEDKSYISIIDDKGEDDLLISFDDSLLPFILKTFREINGFSHEDFRKVLKVDSRSTYGRYESGERSPKITDLQKILNLNGYDLMIKKIG